MSQTRIREIALELNQIQLDREAEEREHTERQKELLRELVRLTSEAGGE
jgi:hypothetical protein